MSIDPRAQIARCLIDAEELGDDRAAEKHKTTRQNIALLRKRYSNDPVVLSTAADYKHVLQEDWLHHAKEVRRKALRNLESVLATSTPIQLAKIFSTVHEGILASQVIQANADQSSGPGPEPCYDPPLAGDPNGAGQTNHPRNDN